MSFKGAKLALFLGSKLLVILRDDRTDIPYPAHWDFPGGGREDDETPQDCALRETQEEVGLVVLPKDVCFGRRYATPDGDSWFFVAHLDGAAGGDIRFGDEGQGWALMDPKTYLAHPLAIPEFQSRLRDYLGQADLEQSDDMQR